MLDFFTRGGDSLSQSANKSGDDFFVSAFPFPSTENTFFAPLEAAQSSKIINAKLAPLLVDDNGFPSIH